MVLPVQEVSPQVGESEDSTASALREVQKPSLAPSRQADIGRQGVYGYVYVLHGRVGRDIQFIKIGKTLDPITRIDGIAKSYDAVQPLLPFRIEIGPVFKCWIGNEGYAEKWLHERFSAKRLRGEWFVFDNEISEFFDHETLEMPFPVLQAWPEAIYDAP